VLIAKILKYVKWLGGFLVALIFLSASFFFILEAHLSHARRERAPVAVFSRTGSTRSACLPPHGASFSPSSSHQTLVPLPPDLAAATPSVVFPLQFLPRDRRHGREHGRLAARLTHAIPKIVFAPGGVLLPLSSRSRSARVIVKFIVLVLRDFFLLRHHCSSSSSPASQGENRSQIPLFPESFDSSLHLIVHHRLHAQFQSCSVSLLLPLRLSTQPARPVPVPDRVLRVHQSRPAALTHAGAYLAARPCRARRLSCIGTLANLR
jgi:hypothetical protein